jgi:ABC-type amino acid transport substrate-binding protein
MQVEKIEAKEINFKTSLALKNLFNTYFEKWSLENRAGYDELARRCGLTGAYISQIGRYGRVPSKSALILLALNFELRDPSEILKAAEILEIWPYPKSAHLSFNAREAEGFLSVKIDMDGLAKAIQSAVGKEIRPRSVKDLLQGRSLKIGFNPFKFWLFESTERDIHGEYKGFFPEICRMLGVSIQAKIDQGFVEYPDYPAKFASGELDIFGPVVVAPNLPTNTIFTNPLYRIGMSAMYRVRAIKDLDTLPMPEVAEDLLNPAYRIAVVRNSRAHLLCNTRFRRTDKDLVICRTTEEALDRTMLKGVSNPAHLFMCNSVDAVLWDREFKRDLKAIFIKKSELLDLAEAGIAVRSDWPELVSSLNDIISFLSSTGTISQSLNHWVPEGMEGLIEAV